MAYRVPKIYVIKASEFEKWVRLKVEFLYRMYEDEFDEEILDDIMYGMSKSPRFLEKGLIKYLVNGKLGLQFIQEIGKIDFKDPFMILDFEN